MTNNIKTDFQKTVMTFYNNCKHGKRYQSWEHCKNFFDNNKFDVNNFDNKVLTLEDWNNIENNLTQDNKDKLDLMCLHLAFYLASWGMYRGSAFILQYDYKKHKKAILILLQEKYKSLWIIDKNSERDFLESVHNIDLLFNKNGLINELKDCYKNNNTSQDDEPTITLVTKILMGTMGCIPAFDRFLECGLRDKKYDTKIKNVYNNFIKDCKNEGLFRDLNISYYNKPYPRMKIIDMYFWEIGYEQDIINWLKGENLKKDTKCALDMLNNKRTEKRALNKINKIEEYFKDDDEIKNIIKNIMDKYKSKKLLPLKKC